MNEELVFLLHRLIPALNEGLIMSVKLIVPSAVLGLFFGVVVGTCRAFGRGIIKPLANGYAALFRGTPLVIQLFILYFGLPGIGIYLEPYTAAVLGFTFCSAAYHSEYIRGGLLSIKQGQLLAAQALGFSTLKTLTTIIIPQAFRRALPGCGNEIVYLIKYSSLAYVITCFELTGKAKVVASESFRFSEVFLVVGLYYLVLVSVASWGLSRLENKLKIPGFGH
ncbi:MAG: amino acid ABC transporter permease [Desulfomicrobium sp.]|nr:amino acid ABC transporter permease [Desulfomicrobium sp.]NLV97772.1 amino acid ABC transporter permease [Desulfovibrionales bacterium]